MGIEQTLISQVYDKELLIAEQNQQANDNDYESYLGIIAGERDEKTYEWQSDIRIPEFMSHFLTQASIDVGQYFQTRDFVEVKINDPSEEAKLSADSAKECINRTLNKREVQHYLKFVRGKGINTLSGRVWAKCWWEQEFEEQQTGTRIEIEQLDVDINGEPLVDEFQEPALQEKEVPVFEDVAVKDFFNYDIWDQRNVFASPEYVYSAQDKEWITFRSETTLSELEAIAENNEYFNLDKIGKPPSTTDTKQESYQKHETKQESTSQAQKPFDLIERYGRFWYKDGKIGLDENGDVLDGATYEECIITLVKDRSEKILIGFGKTHFIDAYGRPYKPVIRGLCYIHPAEDNGMGDGQNVRELQTAVDDTFNISQDRVMLATLPSLKGKKHAIEDNTSIYIAPMHMMELDDTNDVQEFQISDNITGALNQLAYLEDKGRQVDSINEVTTGGVPSIASTTATAVGAANQNTNTRINYKSLTFEYTFLTELYWMIQQMTYAFAQEETGFELMGDKLKDFNPSLDYYYTPLSQSIESESSKMTKRKEWMTVFQAASQIQHPGAPALVNYAFGEFVKLMGDEYESATTKFLNEQQPMERGQSTPEQGGVPTSNEYGQPQSPEQMQARANA